MIDIDPPVQGAAGPAPQGTLQATPKTVSQFLGEIVWLLTQSPTHKQLFIGDLEWFCMAPLLLEQFRIFYQPVPGTTTPGPTPAAVALWAQVSDETHARLREGGFKLRGDEWKGGEHLWLIELVAPFGAQDEILRDLRHSVFAGRPFNFHHVTAEGKRVVATFDPATGALVH